MRGNPDGSQGPKAPQPDWLSGHGDVMMNPGIPPEYP